LIDADPLVRVVPMSDIQELKHQTAEPRPLSRDFSAARMQTAAIRNG